MNDRTLGSHWQPLSVAMAMVAMSLAGCEGATADAEPEVELAQKVLIVGIDGCRPDALVEASTPHLDVLLGGAWTLTATTQTTASTVSGPGWASIFTGVEPTKHLVDGNDDLAERSADYPTLIQRAYDFGLGTSLGANWAGILSLVELDAVDELVSSDDAGVTEGMVEILRDDDLDVHFVALDDVDHAGHAYGYSIEVPEYLDSIEVADSQFGDMLDAIDARATRTEEAWLFVVTTDHGGLGTGHSIPSPDTMTIPMLFLGPDIDSGELSEGSHLDVHPTLFAWLGLGPEPEWDLDGSVISLWAGSQ